MNKTKIEYVDYVWNVISGCLNSCTYCYARKIYRRFKMSFKPKMHYDRLWKAGKVKKPARIFVNSVSDFWSKGIKQEWRDEIYEKIKMYSHHTYLILSKRLDRMTEDDCKHFPDQKGVWLGMTIDCSGSKCNINTLTNLKTSGRFRNLKTFVSFEPLLGDPVDYVNQIAFKELDWIVVGRLTGFKDNKYLPKPEWVETVVRAADQYGIKVFLKNNLKGIWPGRLRQEIPS